MRLQPPLWPFLHFHFLALGILLGALAGVAQTVRLETDHTAYLAGEDVWLSFSGGPGNAGDWIGVYAEGTAPGEEVIQAWRYVDGTQVGRIGFREGQIRFPAHLHTPGNWVAHFLPGDQFTAVAQAAFSVLEPGSPLVRASKRAYAPGAPISVSFVNGPGNPGDRIALYPRGAVPGDAPVLQWVYVDGSQTGAMGLADGTVLFPSGLNAPGQYDVHLLLDNGFDSVESDPFEVAEIAASVPRVLYVDPPSDASEQPAVIGFRIAITNGATHVTPSSIVLSVNGNPVSSSVVPGSGLSTVIYTNTALYPPGSSQTHRLTWFDDAVPPRQFAEEVTFTVAAYRNIVLPSPIHFENFDDTPEGTLPPGWTHKSYTEITNPEEDFGNLDSATYARWTVVDADRFNGTFVTYSNPDSQEDAYQLVLAVNPLNVLNGAVYREPLARGRFAFGNSGFRNGLSQVLFLYSPDYNLAGRTNIHLCFHGLWEQNHDSIAAIEYSIDRGQSWLPIAYFLEAADILMRTNEVNGGVEVDAVNTFITPHLDVARYYDDEGNQRGGTYGTFIGAPLSQDLASYLQPRKNANPVESKRIELFRLPAADNQPAVRLRFAHAGTDSWYFGIDNVGLYSLSPSDAPAPVLSFAWNDGRLTLTWPATAADYVLESATRLDLADWAPVSGISGTSHAVEPAGDHRYFRLRQ